MQRLHRAVIGLLKHGEIHHPQRRPLTGVQIEVSAELTAQCAKCLGDNTGLVGAKENQITVIGRQALEDGAAHLEGQKFNDGRLQAVLEIGFVNDLDVSQTLSAVNTDKLSVIVDLLAA